MIDSLKKTYRLWWQKPAKATEREEEREISFLELFYDLAYVVIVIQLTYVALTDLSWSSVLQYAALFAMVWWAWVNGSMYHELHGNNDVRTRIFTFAQMFALAGIGIFLPTAFGNGHQGFAIAYAAFLTIVTVLWWRANVHDPAHRPLGIPYLIGFSGTVIAFAASAFFDTPTAYYFWLAGIVFSLLMPALSARFASSRASAEQLEAAQRVGHPIVERFGLLTIIVLGEIVISIVSGSSDYMKSVTLDNILIVFFSLSIVVAMWWIYFDFAARRLPEKTQNKRMAWLYLHLPFMMSIGLTSAGILSIIQYPEKFTDEKRLLLVVALVLFLITVHLIMRTLTADPHVQAIRNKLMNMTFIAAVVMLSLLLTSLNAVLTLGIMSVILYSPIAAAFLIAIQQQSK